MVDSRIVHTQAALTQAILDLASQRPVSEIAVSELARHAGVNRATFYNHYLSPGALLGTTVTHELDRVRETDHSLRESSERPGEEITRLAVDSVVAYVEKYRRLFELTLLDPQDSSLHRALADHFEVSCRHHLLSYASSTAEIVDVDILARFVAEGIVGAIEAWLVKPGVSAEQLTDVIVSALPTWWH